MTGGGGSGATAYCKINAAGVIIGLYLISVGTGYTSAPSVTFTSADGNGSGADRDDDDRQRDQREDLAVHRDIEFVARYVHDVQSDRLVTGDLGAGQSGTYAYTLYNEFLFSPQDTAAAAPSYPSRSNPLRRVRISRPGL